MKNTSDDKFVAKVMMKMRLCGWISLDGRESVSWGEVGFLDYMLPMWVHRVILEGRMVWDVEWEKVVMEVFEELDG